MGTERRKDERLGLAIPVRVQGFLAGGGTWEELSSTADVSARGAAFPLNHKVELGQVLFLNLALPRRLRQHDTHDASYRVYSLVRVVQKGGERARVGVMFFGKYPPRGFHEHPAGRYLLPGDPMPRARRVDGGAVGVAAGDDAGSAAAPLAAAAPAEAPASAIESPSAMPPAPVPGVPAPEFLPPHDPSVERRGSPRADVFVNFVLQQADAEGKVLQQELTVADNIGRGGIRVMTTLAFRPGDVVLLQEAGGAFATRAEVRAVTRPQPAFTRLHLRFLDRQAPDRLLR